LQSALPSASWSGTDVRIRDVESTMNVQAQPRVATMKGRLPFECVALMPQGGGALGAYQAGVYEALVEAGIHPDWVAGISIGAINSALIAGNPPERRVDRLRAFWEGITTWLSWFDWANVPKGDAARKLLNQLYAGFALVAGAPGLFAPRYPPPWLYPPSNANATSLYDTSGLRAALERLVDFDRLNAGATRLSIGADNVRSGNFVFFDTKTHTIGPEHIMASGALPPGFPSIEIEGEHYWDGGLVSNTPLQWVVESQPRLDTLAFQVDLWSARGELPRSFAEVSTRQKEIQYSSRTRASTDSFKRVQRLRRVTADLLDKLPEELRRSPEAALLRNVADRKVYNIVHLIYRAKSYEGPAKDYEFSRGSMEDHWRAGYYDVVRTLRHPRVVERPTNHEASLLSTSQ
jgi:NTE family protein